MTENLARKFNSIQLLLSLFSFYHHLCSSILRIAIIILFIKLIFALTLLVAPSRASCITANHSNPPHISYPYQKLIRHPHYPFWDVLSLVRLRFSCPINVGLYPFFPQHRTKAQGHAFACYSFLFVHTQKHSLEEPPNEIYFNNSLKLKTLNHSLTLDNNGREKDFFC